MKKQRSFRKKKYNKWQQRGTVRTAYSSVVVGWIERASKIAVREWLSKQGNET